MAYTNDYLTLMGSPEPTDIIIETLEISHTNFTKTYYLCNYNENFTGDIPSPTVFEPAGFRITLPTQNESGNETFNLVLDATDRVIIDELELAITTYNEPIDVKYRPFIFGDSTPQIDNPFTFKLFNVTYENGVVTGTGNLPEFNNYKFPRNVYKLTEFPALRDT